MSSEVPSAGFRRSTQLIRDQSIQILTLQGARHSRKEIVALVGATVCQVQGTIRSGRVSPFLRNGRPLLLSPSQVNELENFVRCSYEAR